MLLRVHKLGAKEIYFQAKQTDLDHVVNADQHLR
jgi:hypothetical protein